MRFATSQGNIINLDLCRADIQRAIDIYGSQNVLHGRSRILLSDTRVVRAEPQSKTPQELFTDKFFVDGMPFMLGCAKPLGILLVRLLAGESEAHLEKIFEEFICILLSYQFVTTTLYSDADPAVVAQINKRGKVRVEVCAGGDHVNEIE